MNNAMKRNILECSTTAIKAVTCVKYVKYVMESLWNAKVGGNRSTWSHVEVSFKDNPGKKLKHDDSESHKEAVVVIANLKIDWALKMRSISIQEMRKGKLMNFT